MPCEQCAIDVSVTSGKIEQQEKLLKDIVKAMSHLASMEAERQRGICWSRQRSKTGHRPC
jgi:hypothetical protein